MMNMNDAKKRLLENEDEKPDFLDIDTIVKGIVDKTKLIKNCVIFDEDGSLDEKEIHFDKIMKFVENWTGYEYSCNEISINKYNISANQFLILAEKMYTTLSQKYCGKKFVVIIYVTDEVIDLRFHTYRRNDGIWIDENLNNYDSPVLYWM